jgi:DNA polymerase-1
MQYGASHFKVAALLGVGPEEGLLAFNKYWATYSGLKREMDECAKLVDEGTPIVTLYGRKRRFEKRDRKPWDQAYRQSWNAKVQGTGADMTSVSFYRVHEELKHRGWGYGLWTVHDEILISVYEQYAVDAERLLVQTMVSVGEELGLTVPLKAESAIMPTRWED